jgi:RNA polymerase sigma-70 factor (ECF subfamily)
MAGEARESIGMWNPFNADPPAPVSADDDAVLVSAARCDPAAFAALYRRYVTPIYRYVYSRVGSDADAQDLTAQVFLEALESLPRYRDRGNFAAWLFTIARRRAIDHYRRRSPLPLNDTPDPDDDNDPLSHVIEYETLDRLKDLIVQLNDDQRELLRLRFAAGLTFGQIGLILRRNEAAVKMALHRLLDQLRVKWRAQDEHTQS